jgi:hypothetical protein
LRAAPLVVSDTDEILELNNGCEIIVSFNSFRAIRGRTFALAIMDEVCIGETKHSPVPTSRFTRR